MLALRSARSVPRRGTVLILVLVVVVVLSLGAYTFSEFMVLEAKSAILHGQAVRSRALADSGVELVAAQLADRINTDPLAIYDNPQLYRGATLSGGSSGAGRFTVIAPVPNDTTGRNVRYGLIDESGKININTMLKLKVDEEQARLMLSYLPGSDPEMADSILDFIDEDDETREFGAESDVYPTKNGPLDSLDELMLVQGITPSLLFGEDANRNGLLDPNENDGTATLPLDNADGRLDRGWSAFLTVHSRERNTQADGSDRIHVNNNILTDLYDELAEAYDADVATFVVAYRVSGPVPDENDQTSTTPADPLAPTGQGQTQEQAAQGLALSIGRAVAGSDGSGKVTRGGMELGNGAKFNVGSIYDLIGVQVEATVNGARQTLDSPWASDPGAMAEYLPDLMDKLCITKGPFVEGRINVNQAAFEALAGLPGMTEELARGIESSQQVASTGMSLTGQVSTRATTGWLLMEGLADLPAMRKLDPYLTARGDVYRLQVVGFFDKGGPVSRVEAILDATEDVTKILFMRDLTDLGRGYPLSLLGAN